MEAQGPNSARLAGNSSPIATIAGVRSYAVGDGGGNAVESHGGEGRADEIVAISVVAANTFAAIGNLLGIGETAVVTARSPKGCWVVGYRNGYCIAVEVDASAPSANIEFAVRGGEWLPKVEWEVADAEIEYVAPAAPGATAPSPVAKPPRPAQPGAMTRPPAQRTHSVSKAPGAVNAPSMVNANSKGLRRAIAKGDLRAIREIAEHLRGASASKTDPCGAGASADAIGPLVSGIASVLSGDNTSALKLLDSASQVPEAGPTLQWAASLWSSKASIGMSEGLDAALIYAESAARISKQLDAEARAVSHRNLAEVSFHRRDSEHTSRYIEVARRLAESLQDQDSLAELALLQAKTHLFSKDVDAAANSATQALALRAHWIAPTLLLCRCALIKGDIKTARELVADCVADGSTAPEMLRLWRLVDMAKRGALSPQIVVEYLTLEESAPTRTNIARLEELCDAHPRVDAFRETFGWKLLKSGDVVRANVVFERLSHRTDLPDDIRSSVLLALGWLAAYQTRNVSSGTKLRATVDAAPKHLQSARPPAASSSHMRAASPVDMASIAPPPSSLAAPVANGAADGAPRSSHAVPVFTGNLEVFCLPDLLEFLRAGRRTGTLVCSSVRGIGAVHLSDGKLSGAAAPNTPRLSELLLAKGKVSEADLKQAAATQEASKSSMPIGTILVKEGRLKTEDLQAALRAQVEGAIAELLAWGEGQFAFDAESRGPAASEGVEIALDPQSVLLEIYRAMDEQGTVVR